MGRELGYLSLSVFLLAGTSFFSVAWSAEYIRSESTAPDSVAEADTALDVALEKKEREVSSVRLGKLKRKLEDYPAWLRDATLDLNLRGYDFKRVNRDDSINQAFTLGGELGVTTGKFARFARVGLSYYYSGGLYAPEDRGFTGLLTADQQDLATLGRAYLQLGDADKFALRLYRQILDMPYMNKDDSRMIPTTHQGYMLGRKGTGWDFGLGHIEKIKLNSSEKFLPMSAAAGALDTDKGVTIAGYKADLTDDIALGGFNLYGWDTFNTFYAEGSWLDYFLGQYGVKNSVQFTDQRSVGEELVGSFNTNSFGLSTSGGRDGRILTLAYTQSGSGGLVRNPWGGIPSYNSMMLQSFNRAGEKSLRLGFSWSGKAAGLEAWSGIANIASGWDAIDAGTRESLPDVTEYDLTLGFKPTKGAAKGIWLRLRGAYADFDDDTSRWNARLILNYPLHLL